MKTIPLPRPAVFTWPPSAAPVACIVHAWSTSADDGGSAPVAVIEFADGRVEDVSVSTITFTDQEIPA